jgi:hypothetical protein
VRVTYVRHEDDDWIDEFRLLTSPRWKESELSGDEWRFSTYIEAYRKGVLLGTARGGQDLKDAAIALPQRLWFFGGTAIGDAWKMEPDRDDEFWNEYCFQPTCRAGAIYEMRRLHHYCHEGGTHDRDWREERMRFCERHKRRGDCDLNDADRNYEVVALKLPDGTWMPVEVEQVSTGE